mmetsp:Transcript_19506/g.28729  ORF Transcript_19506/g.28729 Transcript_19506/m.28729 type:complete len:443 (+) Transcript_19506:54-1382(+)
MMIILNHNSLLILHKKKYNAMTTTAFLSNCNEYEVSYIAWSYAMARRRFCNNNNNHDDQFILVALTNRMLQYDIMESCTASSASRMLWSFTTLLSLNGYYDYNGIMKNSKINNDDSNNNVVVGNNNGNDDDEDNEATSSLTTTAFIPSSNNADNMHERQGELFHKLGGILLSSQLTPVDATYAMWAMAKASYAADMGIFDHLSEVVARGFEDDDDDEQDKKNTLNAAVASLSVRQVSQALWACGRMIAFEDPLRDKMEFGEAIPPPYLRHAKKYASFLLSSKDKLSPKDVAQSIWALGRLKISDDSILEPFAKIAAKLSSSCNSQEIANIMWGLGTLGFDRGDIVAVLVDRITSNAQLKEECTSQEASNVMYALGQMKIHDKDAFESLSSVMMKKLSDATPQGIANALWAHEVMKISPPQGLFDCWAKKKLGIVGLIIKQDD